MYITCIADAPCRLVQAHYADDLGLPWPIGQALRIRLHLRQSCAWFGNGQPTVYQRLFYLFILFTIKWSYISCLYRVVALVKNLFKAFQMFSLSLEFVKNWNSFSLFSRDSGDRLKSNFHRFVFSYILSITQSLSSFQTPLPMVPTPFNLPKMHLNVSWNQHWGDF